MHIFLFIILLLLPISCRTEMDGGLKKALENDRISDEVLQHGGTVTIDGLIWQQRDDNIQRIWEEASDYCSSLELAGETDWRLPSMDELKSIIESSNSPTIDITKFPGTHPAGYWSSTADVVNTGFVEGVDFSSGGWLSYSKDTHLYTRCVRSASAEPTQFAIAVDSPELSFSNSGDADWFVQSSESWFGGSSVQSGDIGDNQKSCFQTTMTGPGSLSFYWKVSSESCCDYLKFYIDSAEQGGISGTPSWRQKSYSLSSGSKTLKWCYEKDGSNISGSDAGWVDRIIFQAYTYVDYSSAYNDYGGFYNAPYHPNERAFAALKRDGSIAAWGNRGYGGSGVPTGTGYTKIYSTDRAFVALKTDGSMTAWGDSNYGGSRAPSGLGYTKIYSNGYAFAAMKRDGSIAAWGNRGYGGSGVPTGTGYTKIYSTQKSFAALKADGSITAWGLYGGSRVPTDAGYTKIYSTSYAFAALKTDGSITAWGRGGSGGSGAPTGTGYNKIYSTGGAFAALKADGSITAWGDSGSGGSRAPTDAGYTKIYSTSRAFAALKANGSITAWGDSDSGGSRAPDGSNYTKIYSTCGAFTALKADGSIAVWGISYSNNGVPRGNGYTNIYSTCGAFAALKADGSITAWGGSSYGRFNAPNGSGYRFR
jgi:hypothetical protein